jgi:hypothetical protein
MWKVTKNILATLGALELLFIAMLPFAYGGKGDLNEAYFDVGNHTIFIGVLEKD